MSDPLMGGEQLKSLTVPLMNFNGWLEEVNDEKKKLKVRLKSRRAQPGE